MDIPDARKLHARPTPLMGGVVLILAVAPVVMAGVAMGWVPGWRAPLSLLMAALVAMALVGLADDRHTLSARDRLIVSFLVFGMAATFSPVFCVRVLTFDHPPLTIGLWTDWFAVMFTTLCCVGLVNAVNMADGKNGLVLGLCLGWLGLLATRASPPMILPMAVLGAALFVLLLFNLRGRLFLGDGGAYGIAAVIGLLAIATYNTPGPRVGRAIAAEELMILFAVPVLDSFRLTFVRLSQGRSPMSADRDHLHHHLQAWFGWPGGLLIYWAVAVGVPAVLLLTVSPG